MANTTFNGPVRSENGFKDITKDATTGAVTTNISITHDGTNSVVIISDLPTPAQGMAIKVQKEPENNE